MEDKIRKAIKEQIKKLTEGMSPEEWADAKEKERLNQHPEKDTINKIKKMMDKENKHGKVPDGYHKMPNGEIMANKDHVDEEVMPISLQQLEKEIKDLVLILNAGGLEKKSKIRTLFEKNKGIICVPFYEDNDQTLSALVHNFFRKNKVPISQQSINLIVQRSRGDRLNLQNELEKIQSYTQNKTKIEIEELLKLTNLAENYSVSELIDGCLAKNKKKTINILNENNYSLDDCILIIRTFLIKSKRLLRLSQEMKGKKNIEAVISTFKPPIFWKDKEAVKQQVRSWSFINIENLVYRINEVELLIKKNSSNSVNILSDFIIEQATTVSN